MRYNCGSRRSPAFVTNCLSSLVGRFFQTLQTRDPFFKLVLIEFNTWISEIWIAIRYGPFHEPVASFHRLIRHAAGIAQGVSKLTQLFGAIASRHHCLLLAYILHLPSNIYGRYKIDASPRIGFIEGLSFGTALIYIAQRIEKFLLVLFEVVSRAAISASTAFSPALGARVSAFFTIAHWHDARQVSRLWTKSG